MQHDEVAGGDDEAEPIPASDGGLEHDEAGSYRSTRAWRRSFGRGSRTPDPTQVDELRAQLAQERAAHEESKARLGALQERIDNLSADVDGLDLDNAELRKELAKIRAIRDRERRALMQMGEFYPAEYRDSLELTYYIGSTPDEDRVSEKRSILPDPVLPFVVLRPTVPKNQDKRVPFDAIEFEVKQDFGEVGTIRCVLLEDSPQPIKCMICFAPSIRGRLGWTIQYRMPGLWDELRSPERRDETSWTLVDRGGRANLVHFTVNFVFPVEMRNPIVLPVDDRGCLTGPTETAGGLTLIRWDCPQPTPGSHDWILRVERDG